MEKSESRAKIASIGGALVAAVAASSCCILPVMLAAVGVGGGTAAMALLGPFRPYLLVGTAALCAAGFYFTYRKPRAVEACGCARSGPRSSLARGGLWLATLLVVFVALWPNFGGWVEAREAQDPPSSVHAEARIEVDGMDCEACAAPMRRALGKVGGFHGLTVDLPGRAIIVSYEPAPGRVDAYVDAIYALGYDARVAHDGASRP
jgi:mercuric ion transport protein